MGFLETIDQMGWDRFGQLSLLMFLEFAIWGAWAPVLAARLLGPLKLSGKQTGWVYSTLPLACIFTPLITGALADQYFPADKVIGVAHLIGAVFMFFAASQTKFWPLFLCMLGFSACYAGTLPLVNAVMFTDLGRVFSRDEVIGASGLIFLWAPVAWACAGYLLTGWRNLVGENEGRDCMYFAALLAAVMGVVCLTPLVPYTPPAEEELALFAGFQMFGEPNFVILLAISLVVAGLMQFYFMGTAPFMQKIGIASRYVPGAMALAQVAQAIATLPAFMWLMPRVGYQWTLAIGAACWIILYLIYIAQKRVLVGAAQPLHGIAYVFFILIGQGFAEAMAPEPIRSSVQALVFAATTGLGLFLFTHFAGAVMDRFSVEGEFQWPKIWTVPAAIMTAGVLALAIWAVTAQPLADEPEEVAEQAAAVAAAGEAELASW